ncbi:MAG: glycosyltransferase [Sandaracinaceae bacterium]|nr:glycosyltransferase [Sandaracinaceae bacterium]
MRATVVIPTYKRSSRLRALLGCLTEQRDAAGASILGDRLARVVVCDDGSPDDTAEVVRSFEGRLPLAYRHQPDLGFRAGQARNMGIESAIGDVVIFVDDDVVVSPHFVEAHVEAHEEGFARGTPRLVIGFRHRRFGEPSAQPSLEEIRAQEADDRVPVIGPEGEAVGSQRQPWIFVYSCNFSVPRGASELVFDDGFVGWGLEDIDAGYRLWRSGLAVHTAPRARVLHIEDPAPRDPFRCEERSLPPVYDTYVRNAVYFMDKHPHDQDVSEWVRRDLRWYVRDEARGAWVKNGHANDVDRVITHSRAELAAAGRTPRPHTIRPFEARRAPVHAAREDNA